MNKWCLLIIYLKSFIIKILLKILLLAYNNPKKRNKYQLNKIFKKSWANKIRIIKIKPKSNQYPKMNKIRIIKSNNKMIPNKKINWFVFKMRKNS